MTVKLGQLFRYKGHDSFFAGIWKVVKMESQDEIVLSDMYGTATVKTHNKSFLNYFELFVPPQEPRIRWKTRYLGVVDE